MKGILAKFVVIGVMAFAITGSQLMVSAAEGDTPAMQEKAGKSQRVIPFRGKVAAVNLDASTVTVGSRTFKITGDTRIISRGAKATLADAKVGEAAGGAYRTADDGSLVAVSIRFGPKSEVADTE